MEKSFESLKIIRLSMEKSFSSILPALLITISLLIYLAWHFYYKKYKRLPSGPYGLPLLGYLPFLNPRKPYETLQRLALKYGPIYSLRLGNVDAVVLADARLIREFFRHEELTARAPLYVTHGIMGGYGLICAEGALWKNQRRHTIDWLRNLGMTKKSTETRAMLEQRITKGVMECLQDFESAAFNHLEFDPLSIVQHTLGNIINDLVFGITYERNDRTWIYFQELQEKGLKLIGVSGVVNFLPFLRFLPTNRRSIQFLLEGKAETHRIYDRIIRKCKQKLIENDKYSKNTDQKVNSILEYFLLERERRLSSSDRNVKESVNKFYNDIQLRHLLADLFGAGVDTSLTTLRWFLLYMALNPKCQAELQKQLQTFTPNNITLANLESIDYLRACISEVQRIRSVVPLGIPHGTISRITIEGYELPAKCMVIPLLYAVHMNPIYWPEPNEFRPERFLNKDTGTYEQPQQFLPFQSGKRMCMGDELARMILYLYAGLIFSNFKLRLSPKTEGDLNMDGECGITWAPMHYKLNVEKIASTI